MPFPLSHAPRSMPPHPTAAESLARLIVELEKYAEGRKGHGKGTI